MIPPLGNEFNNMMKVTSLLSRHRGAGAVPGARRNYNSPTFRTFEIFLGPPSTTSSLTTIWGFIQAWIESQAGRRQRHEKPSCAIGCSAPRVAATADADAARCSVIVPGRDRNRRTDAVAAADAPAGTVVRRSGCRSGSGARTCSTTSRSRLPRARSW